MKTLALVIGNDAYSPKKLDNAVNDANGIADVFRRLDFEVIFKENCLTDDVPDLLAEFRSKILDFEASIFYFAGHGFEFEGENYLANIDCALSDFQGKDYYNYHCIRLNDILGIFRKKPNNINIAIIDACRKSFDRGANIGFSSIQAPKGTLLAFSTSPNEGAKDKGFEGHSIFTGALLQYIGRESLSVESLFKKVRQTVYNLTNGTQITWEHSSLIGDYYFNIGQLVHSLSIPYSDDVVKDKDYVGTDEFGKLIGNFKSYHWGWQNQAFDEFVKIPVQKFNKNKQFILGRNILQMAEGSARSAQNFISDIASNILRYSENEENHVLNGILFEIYFDSKGEFRKDKTKKNCFDTIISLRKNNKFQASFRFIQNLLRSTGYDLIYIPEEIDYGLDIDVSATQKEQKQCINKILFNMIDITSQIAEFGKYRVSEYGLKKVIAEFLTAPLDLVHIHSNIDLHEIIFEEIDKNDNKLPF